MRSGALGELLADAGAVVGGGAALGATVFFVVGSVARDLGMNADPEVWPRRGGLWGGLAGIVAFSKERRLGVMSERTRLYVMVVIGVAAILVLGRVGDGWSKAEFYGACAGVIALGAIGIFWVQMAADGDLRRRPRD